MADRGGPNSIYHIYSEAEKAGGGKDTEEAKATEGNDALCRESGYKLMASPGGGGEVDGGRRDDQRLRYNQDYRGFGGGWGSRLENPCDGKWQTASPLRRHTGRGSGSSCNDCIWTHKSQVSGHGGRSRHGERRENGGQKNRPGRVGFVRRYRFLGSGGGSIGRVLGSVKWGVWVYSSRPLWAGEWGSRVPGT